MDAWRDPRRLPLGARSVSLDRGDTGGHPIVAQRGERSQDEFRVIEHGDPVVLATPLLDEIASIAQRRNGPSASPGAPGSAS
jgi:hypothetical protein